LVFGQFYSAPAGIRPARRGSEASILPGGRLLVPAGEQFPTGPGPLSLALSASGKTLATINTDLSITVLEHAHGWGGLHQFPLPRTEEPAAGKSGTHATAGFAIFREHSAFLSEGSSGRLALIDLSSGERRSAFDLNRNGIHDSYTGDLIIDAPRNVLYVADWANSRVVAIDARLGVIDAKPRGILSSVMLEGRPNELALSPDGKKLYVTELESDSVSVVDAASAGAVKVESVIHSPSPAGVVAAADRVYVSNSRDDSIAVIDAATNRLRAEIPIRIPGFEQLRGVGPAGLAYDPKSGWLLVAEEGLNAVGVIDTRTSSLLGHIPAGWFPTRVLADRGTVFVSNRRGQGVGPSVVTGSGFVRSIGDEGTAGSVSIYTLPSQAELATYTELVMQAAGFQPGREPRPRLPSEIRHVVLIVSSGRAFDEVLGDMRRAGNGPVIGAPELARFGTAGFVDGHRERLSLHDVNVTPNHHAIAQRWAFSDNFYAVPGMHSESWIVVADHLKRTGASFVRFNSAESSDTARVHHVLREIQERYIDTGTDFPQLVYIDLPGGRLAKPRPGDGYPYEESFVVDNDNSVGRLLEFLSGTKWWPNMAVFLTEDAAQGPDHIDAYRTVLLCAGPWAKRNYVSHTNSSLSGLWKTVFELLHVPSLSLFDASAADLSDLFSAVPDAGRYQTAPVDVRLFDPEKGPRP
jgi:YVTN family beta-propeller protein